MKRKIVGVTVGTPMSPQMIREKLKPVTSVNGVEADNNGNVDVPKFTDEDKKKIVDEVVESIESDDILKLTPEELETLRELLLPYSLECAPVMTLSRSSGSTSGTRWYRVNVTVTGISKSLIQKLEVCTGTRNPSNTNQVSYSSYKAVTGAYDDSREMYTATYNFNYSGSYFAGFKVRLTYTHPVEGTKTMERTV